jgi:3-deoxy-D-manno-octulosonic-acid transferase
MFLYNVLIKIYYLIILTASPFNNKAKLWIKGRKNLFNKLQGLDLQNQKVAWFHAASLGEFEQGRPVIEAFKNKFKDYKIILTFFSPSGFEIRKNYKQADCVLYLPLDTKKNAKRFIKAINPAIAFFIKYEFWYNHLKELQKKQVPVILISGIFREKQIFFLPVLRKFFNIPDLFNHFFVQNKKSVDILARHGYKNVTLISDTRFDRVIKIAAESKIIKEVEEFSSGKMTIVAGSTWLRDEVMLIKLIKEKESLKLIIAPHEIHEGHINQIEKLYDFKCIRFSSFDRYSGKEKILIIDNIGMLSSLYKYGTIAYIGGGFGKGIHNILEAAVYGIPVIFGPNYKKFNEAIELINLNGAYSILNYNELINIITDFINTPDKISESGQICYNYVKNNEGSTDKIISYIDNLIK